MKLATLAAALVLVSSLHAEQEDHAAMRRRIIGEAVMSENPKIRQAIKDLKDEQVLDQIIRGEFLPGQSTGSEKVEAAIAVLDQEGFWPQETEQASMSFPGAEFLGLGDGKAAQVEGKAEAASESSGEDGDFSADEKKKLAEIATAHFAKQYPAWPRIHVTGMWKDGESRVVRFMPENKMGVIMFMASYKVWIDGSGAVTKMK